MFKDFMAWYGKYNKLNLDVMLPGLHTSCLLAIYAGAFGEVPFWFLCTSIVVVFSFFVYFILKDETANLTKINNLSGIAMAIGMVIFTNYTVAIGGFLVMTVMIIIFQQLCKVLE